MQLKNMNKTRLFKIAAVFTAVVLLTVFASVVASAENVVIKEDKNTSLTFLRLNGKCADDDWESSGTYSEPEEGKYKFNTNSFNAWYEADRIDIAYRDYNFNFGKQATFTFTGTLNSFNGKANTAQAGLMLRSSTDPGAATVLFAYRPGLLLLMVRSYDNTQFSGLYDKISIPQFKPMELKLEVNKTTVKGYYRYVGQSAWITAGSKKFDYSSTGRLTAAFAACSVEQNFFAEANFSDYNVVIEAPEGTEYTDSGSSSSTGSSSEEEIVKLPDDLPPTDNVLMRETFTDGDIFTGEASVTNPIWTSDIKDPDIITNSDSTNRYLNLFYDNGYYYAGDLGWTDYSVETDIRFTEGTTMAEANEFTFMTRFTDIEQYGYSYVGVHFYTNTATGKRYMEIGHTRSSKVTLFKNIDASTEFDYLADNNTHKLRIDAFDNVFTVYWDGQEILSYTDESYDDVKLKGCIGFYTNNCSVELDNITVTKLYDALGGDYDNKIGGLFNEPMPEYLERYEKNNWCY